MTDTATLGCARKALDEHVWVEAYEGFSRLAASVGISQRAGGGTRRRDRLER